MAAEPFILQGLLTLSGDNFACGFRPFWRNDCSDTVQAVMYARYWMIPAGLLLMAVGGATWLLSTRLDRTSTSGTETGRHDQAG